MEFGLHLLSMDVAVRTILGLEEGEDCVVIGTLYKQMQLKPSVLDEYAKEAWHHKILLLGTLGVYFFQ